MRRTLVFLLVLSMLSVLLLPIAASPVAPANKTVATARRAVEAAVGTDTVGAALLLFESGSVLMSESFGYADIGQGALVTPDTVFEIGELSALFVTLSILQLADEGTLSLDDALTDHLAEDVVKALDLQYPVTLRQLLAGQGGFGGRVMDVAYEKQAHCFETLTEAVLAAVPKQVTRPGTVTVYSDFGIALLALVLEQKTGQPFAGYVTDRFLEPLGMKDTQCPLKFETGYAFATGYTLGEDGRFYTDAVNGRRYAALPPATGVVTTLADMQKFLTWLLSDGALSGAARALLGQTVTSGMLTAGATPLTPLANGALTLTGSTACFGAALTLDFDKGNAALVMANTPTTALLALPVTLFGGAALPLVLPQGDLAELKPLRGTYLPATADLSCVVGRLLALDAGVSLRVKDDTLYFEDKALVQIARGVFADAAAPEVPLLQFLFDEDGDVTALLDADGSCYTPAPAFRTGLLARAALAALLLLGAAVLLFAVWGIIRWVTDVDRYGERDSILPPLSGTLAALCTLLAGGELLLAFRRGAAALSSLYFALQILTLLAGIVATVALILAFATTLLHRKVHRQVASTAIAFVLFFLLCCFFGLTVI